MKVDLKTLILIILAIALVAALLYKLGGLEAEKTPKFKGPTGDPYIKGPTSPPPQY